MSEFYNSADTICAVSTAPGAGGIAVIRLSGPNAIEIGSRIWRGANLANVASHTAHLGDILDETGEILDRGVATVFRGPRSYTGDDTIEFSVHGSRWIQRQLLASLRVAGARLALPGEYTRRAYASGHLDLAQAEAVADIIAAGSRAAHRSAMSQMRGGISRRLAELRDRLLHLASLIELELDFSDQDVEFVDRTKLTELATDIDDEITRLLKSFETGAAVREGFPVAIIGAVNAGKSALLNAILDDERAIVSDIPGTTRDVVEDRREVGDYLIRFLDTAGLRHTTDQIEQIGIERSYREAARAAIVLYVVDSSNPASPESIVSATADIPTERLIYVANKADIASTTEIENNLGAIPVSARKGIGVEKLLAEIEKRLQSQTSAAGDILITAARHAEALSQARESNLATIAAIENGIPTDLIAQDLRETIHHLSAITGAITTPQILNNIFAHFCIGK